MSIMNRFGVYIVLLSLMFVSCKESKKEPVLFEALGKERTGIDFANKLNPTQDFNMFHYMYYYNGAGVGTGDFNNDGKIDIFFASNESDNKLYLNKGGLKFEDVSLKAKIPQDKQWNTGVSVVDINQDGLLDLYICRLGDFEKFKSKNILLLCTGILEGIPQYREAAAEFGVDFSGFSTQSAFFDYDLDGDLDLFLLNHSVHQNGTFAPRKQFLGTYHPLSGDRLFKNDSGKYTDVTKESKIHSSAISYGLGVAVSDIDLDGWPDLYAGNDFHENDYLYINQKNGTFVDESNKRFMHTSQYSMGVDIGDVNNDGFPEVTSMDMLPYDPYILKRSLGEDEYDIAKYKISVGYDHQYTRNNLQLNRRNGQFSEVGLYAGIYATDWSWAALWMDFDNDGNKDLFVANGIPKRMNDMDYVNYVSNREIQEKIRDNKMSTKDIALIEKFPEIKIPNKFFVNKGNVTFDDAEERISNNEPTFSNGAAYADLDGDGDLDIVVNNVNDDALVYENKSNTREGHAYVELQMKGDSLNRNAIGSRVYIFTGNQVRLYEKYATKGFMSSMEVPMIIGMRDTKVDSAFVVWTDNSSEKIDLNNSINKSVKLSYRRGLPQFDFNIIRRFSENTLNPMHDITEATGLQYEHKENIFQEFNREPLIPHMVSTEGPALATGDMNQDGLEDIFVGSARSFTSKLFLQKANGKFIETLQPAFTLDSNYEDVDAKIFDVNNDGFPDLVVGSGGNEYFGKDINTQSRVYVNDGKGNLTRLQGAIPVFAQASCLLNGDINKDGFIDLIIFGRVTPMSYGKPSSSYVLINNGKGMFTDRTSVYATFLKDAGMISDADWVDIDKDGDNDIVASFEWGTIDVFINDKGKFSRKEIAPEKGWWNFILPVDIDQDGDMDFIAGNAGLNTRFTPSVKEPLRLYTTDFDENGRTEQVMTYYLDGKEIPFSNKDELQKQFPVIKKKFLYAEDFAKAKFSDMFEADKLGTAGIRTADYFANVVLINEGNLKFKTVALPWLAQLSTYKDAAVINANGDQLPDILLGGNYYDNNIQMGRYDADYGTILINKGNGNLEASSINGLSIKGQVRKIKPVTIKGMNAWVLAKNSDSLRVVSFK